MVRADWILRANSCEINTLTMRYKGYPLVLYFSNPRESSAALSLYIDI